MQVRQEIKLGFLMRENNQPQKYKLIGAFEQLTCLQIRSRFSPLLLGIPPATHTDTHTYAHACTHMHTHTQTYIQIDLFLLSPGFSGKKNPPGSSFSVCLTKLIGNVH